jgi:NitT/TauT family transport system ATP-binding protein
MTTSGDIFLIKLTDISKSYLQASRQRSVLEKISLEIPAGELLSILGPSGCGKSTLLRLVARLEEPDSGKIEFTEKLDRIGYVFQDSNLLPWLTVAENVALPLVLRNCFSKDGVSAALQKVGLQGADGLYPYQLSGGMKMRVSIARAFVNKPQLMLLDEPFSALDDETRFRLQEELRAWLLGAEITMIFVTHSVAEAVFLSSRIAVLGKHSHEPVSFQAVELPEVRDMNLRSSDIFYQQVRRIQSTSKAQRAAEVLR